MGRKHPYKSDDRKDYFDKGEPGHGHYKWHVLLFLLAMFLLCYWAGLVATGGG